MAAVSALERFGLVLSGGSKSNDSVVGFGFPPPLTLFLMKKKTAARMAMPTIWSVSMLWFETSFRLSQAYLAQEVSPQR